MRLEEVRAVTGGKLSGNDTAFASVSIDTRTLQEQDLFVALKGPNFNGNEFLTVAEEKRACAAIVSEPVQTRLPTLQVEDSRDALGVIGSLNRSRTTACVIALTGSQGKTTVKEMTAAILSCCGEVIMTRGNLNNDLGVPLSLTSIEEHHEFAVIELGANGPGEIAYTVGLTRPRIGHITNIAGTHLEGFGDLDGVAKAKSEIWQGIEEGGIAVVNQDDAYAEQFVAQIADQPGERKIVSVSGNGNTQADYYASEVHLGSLRSCEFTLFTPAGKTHLALQISGRHNISNAVAAAAMAMSAGAGLDDVRRGLERFSPVSGRMNVLEGINKSELIDDTYNASPSSFRAAIDVLGISAGTTVVVMGDMGELGSEEERLHREIGRYAREKGVSHFIAVGRLSRLAAESFGENGVFLEEQEEFLNTIRPLLGESVTVLVKGSRSQGMEKLVRQIQAGAQ